MTGLHDAFTKLVTDVPAYGDLDLAIEQATRVRRRRVRILGVLAAAAVLVVVAGLLAVTRPGDGDPQPLGEVPEPTDPATVSALADGPLAPGRYRYVLESSCDEPADCRTATSPPLDIDFTVPGGWQQLPDFPNVITPVSETPTEAPDGAALVLGWTNVQVGLYSDPCRPEDEGLPDVPVGPGVDEFVDAVRAQDALDVTPVSTVQVDGRPARFFTLRVPSDIRTCHHWRPWEPGFYAQGGANIWEVWVVDVEGSRVLIVADYFPGTPARVRAELRAMVQSVTFRR